MEDNKFDIKNWAMKMYNIIIIIIIVIIIKSVKITQMDTTLDWN